MTERDETRDNDKVTEQLPENRNEKVTTGKESEGLFNDLMNFIATNEMLDVMVNFALFIGFFSLLVSIFMPQSMFVAYCAIIGLFGGITIATLQALVTSIQQYRGKLPGSLARVRLSNRIAA